MNEQTHTRITRARSAGAALVTGGSSRLGRNVALHLVRGGHDVILKYRDQEAR